MLQGWWTIVGGGTPEDGSCCWAVGCTTGSCCGTATWTELGGGVSIIGVEAAPFCKYATAAEVSPEIKLFIWGINK